MKTVSEQVRKILEDCPVSRHRLCKLTGINQGNLAGFMTGRRGLSQESLDALGLLLGFEVRANQVMAQKLAACAPKAGRPKIKG